MFTGNILKREKIEFSVNLIIGLILLVTGMTLRTMDISITPNNKALIGVSFIPLATAISKFYRIHSIKKHPKSMNSVIIAENDERLVRQRNESEAITNRIFRRVIYVAFIGYSLVFPSEAFEAVGWWVVLFLFLLAYTLPCIFQFRAASKYHVDEN